MSATEKSSAPKKRLGWLKLLAWGFGALVILLLATYFVATSAAFLKGVILPKVGKAVNAEITVSDASISPFSQVVLKNLKVQTTGSEPLVSATEVRLRYSLTAMLGGNIQVEEVALVTPTIVLETQADGSSNLDPLLKSQKTTATAKSSKALQVELKKLALTDATVRTVKHYAGGKQDTAEVSQINITVENVKNGQAGKVTIGATVALNNNPPEAAKAGALKAKISGGYDFSLTPALMPASAKGNLNLTVETATGLFAQAKDLTTDLNCDLTATEIKQVALLIKQGAASLGQIQINGPLDLNSLEGHLTLKVSNIDKKLLNLASAGLGLDFGTTAIDSTTEIVLAKAASQITATGQFNLKNFQVTKGSQTTPTLGFTASYGVAVDRTANVVVVNTLALNATQGDKALLQSGLSSPMTIALAGSSAGLGDSKFSLALNHLSLADWRPFVSDSSLAGDISLSAQIVSKNGGKQNDIDLGAQIKDVTAGGGAVHVSQLVVASSVSHSTPDFKQNAAKGFFALTNLTAQAGNNRVTNFGAAVSFDVAAGTTQVQLNKIAAALTQNALAAGSLELSGSYTLTNQSAQITAKLADLNQNLLAPFLEPALTGRKLASVAINAILTAQYNPQAASSLKAALDITNLVVADPSQAKTNAPLAVGFQLDGGFDKQVVNLNGFQVALTPTARGSNVLVLSGKIDLSKTNVEGSLKLAADSIDATPYFDLMSPTNASAAQTAASTTNVTAAKTAAASSPASTNSAEEPAAIHLPVRNFTAELDIRRFCLREIDIVGFQGSVKLDDGHLVLNPFKLSLNGAPISSMMDIDVGVPGFKYDVVFNASSVPLAPIVNTFQPARKGIVGGTFTAMAKVAGAGTTGASLQTNLTGQFDFGSTNLNLAGTNMPTKPLKLIVTTVAEVPNLIQNPGGVGLGLLQHTLGGTSTNVDLNKSAVDSIIAKGAIGSGKVEVSQLLIQSPGFQAMAPTTVTLNPVLTNSTLSIPVQVTLARAVAVACRITPDSTNDAYVALPQFLTITGTMGNPQKQIEKANLVKFALKQATAQGAGGNGAAGQALQSVSSLFGGSKSTNSAGGTNSAGKTSSLINNLLGGGNASTNKSATNTSPVNSLIKGFLK
jgi:uncharacterized protein involved in outer membrane biogenesis